MTSRQAGRRMRKFTAHSARSSSRPGSGPNNAARPRRKNEPLRPSELRRLVQLVACGTIFVLLVAVKLLLPAKMAGFNEQLSAALRKNMDIQAVFSAVGRAFDGHASGAMEDVYQAVFHPNQEEDAAVKTSEPVKMQEHPALDVLRTYQKPAEPSGMEDAASEPPEAEPDGSAETEDAVPPSDASTLAYVQYSEENLPDTVSMEQAILGFAYDTPLTGVLTSGFGYREHPIEGEERFHYGVDLAADSGTEIDCFADGSVTAVGESNSYGRYCIVSHESGYSTLYAHCSRVTVSSGAQVTRGQKIAEVGSTGMSTGPHLHFELHKDGLYLNPIYYVSVA